MSGRDIEDLLVACVLDPDVLARLRTDPDAVLGDYALDDDQRQKLRDPDAGLIGLFADVLNAGRGDPAGDAAESDRQAAPSAAGSPAMAPAVTPLPESRLALRLVPYVQAAADEGGAATPATVMYVGHLDPLPDGASVDGLPPVPRAAAAGEPLPPLALEVGIRPVLLRDAAGSGELTFSLTARLPAAAGGASPASGYAGRGAAPWYHDIGSAAVREAASAVHDAAPGDRFRRIAALVEVMTRQGGST